MERNDNILLVEKRYNLTEFTYVMGDGHHFEKREGGEILTSLLTGSVPEFRDGWGHPKGPEAHAGQHSTIFFFFWSQQQMKMTCNFTILIKVGRKS